MKLFYRVSEAKQALGVGTTKLYQLISAGTLDARKLGSNTVITADSLEHYAKGLPKAEIHLGHGTKR